MATALIKPLQITGRDEFRRWAELQPTGRYERINGEIVAMAPERGVHLRLKAAVWLALRSAIATAGVPCEALPDGATVEIDELTDYEPDALVTCGERMADDAIAAPNSVIVVEVLSPATRSVDAGAKLSDYFRVSSIQHYLIVRTDRQEIVHHHRRRDDKGLETYVFTNGQINLDPPGITISVERIYAANQKN